MGRPPLISLTEDYISVHTQGVEFEWDDLKNLANTLKHGIRFEDAKEAFGDAQRIIIDDLEHSTTAEQRHWLIGVFAERILMVVFTFRRGNVRIISARLANQRERKTYEQRKTEHR